MTKGESLSDKKKIVDVHSPHSMALGFSVGTFIAILPTFGVGLALGALAILFLKHINKTWMLGAFVLWNPFALVPLYKIGARIGDFLFHDQPLVIESWAHWNQDLVVTKRFFIGNAVLAFELAVVSYIVLYLLIRFAFKRPVIEELGRERDR